MAQLSHAQTLEITVVDNEGNAVADAVVEVMLPDTVRQRFATAADAGAVVDQVDKEFVPTVTTVVAGSRVSFPNSDDILHHVYSFSPINTFDIPLYGRDEEARFVEQFPQSGVVEIGCNIHDWMLAYIYVAESTLMAKTDDTGSAAISGIPAGTYPVRTWHARLPRGMTEVMDTASIQSGSTTTLQVTLELERDRRIRRAPSANRKRYR